MFSLKAYRQDWFGNIRGDVLSGIVVALALIPEAIAFSLIAGVDPQVGLYASFSIAVITAIAGGRPGMISAATAATAVLMGSLVREHGLDYLLAATVLAGLLQIGMGLLKLGQYMRFISRSVITGFVNALAILIFLAQVPELDPSRVPMVTYPLILGALAVLYFWPKVSTAVPAPLVALVAVSLIVLVFGLDVRVVGDMGALPEALPSFLIPDVPFTAETLQIIFPYALAVAVVGLLESLMTQQIVDDMTDTASSRNQECIGQGLANTATGFIGGMAGCAMIGQSVINVTSGGRGRLSCFVAGVGLLIFCVLLGDWVSRIPMPALVAIMLMVAMGTFNWRSVLDLRHHPLPSSVVMLATVAVVLWTHNLALGVGTGVILSGVFLAGKLSRQFSVTVRDEAGVRIYRLAGQLFYGAVEELMAAVHFGDLPQKVVLDLSAAHLWDLTSVRAVDQIAEKFRRRGVTVELQGLNPQSQALYARLSSEAGAV